ncbi:MAG: site-specific DNA-methyltransferase [Verrucomicrobiota bacterium]
MDKAKLHTPDLTKENIEKIAKLFPSCVTEALSEHGKIERKIDFDQLRQELSNHIVEGPQERYRLDWPGKSEALLAANAPIAKTLRPCREESVDFDTTQNLYIEGDNLEALKLLQETYLGQVKMIYIDPPYNTGNDFIYDDDFAESTEEYLEKSKQTDHEEGRLVANTESNGRFHSDWLSMMYSRLKLAKNLLKDNGVIFISMDDSEFSNLRKVCDEVFGETNFYSSFVWRRRTGSMDSVNNVSTDHEYVLCYGKTAHKLRGIPRTFEKYSNPDKDKRGPWILDNLSASKPGGDTYYPIVDPDSGNEFYPPEGRYWPYNSETMQRKIAEKRIIFPKKTDGTPLLKRFKNEAKSLVVPISSLGTDIKSKSANAFITSLNSAGTKEIKELFGSKVFTFPKPLRLFYSLINQSVDDRGIILDFYSGSATTAHAVMQLNAEDGGNRRYIMVQLPEACNEDSEAYKAGYKTIAEIGKERIRRAAKKIREEHPETSENLDLGFRVLKIDSSNLNNIKQTPDQAKQDELDFQIEHIKPDRTPEDLVFQIMLDWGVDLALPIASETIQSKTVYFVGSDAIAACFDAEITEEFVKELAQRQPLRAVFRDSSFNSDTVKINVGEIFKLLSPGTEVKTL